MVGRTIVERLPFLGDASMMGVINGTCAISYVRRLLRGRVSM